MRVNRKWLVVGVPVAGVAIWLLFNIAFPVVDPSFATKATLRLHYIDQSIDMTMTDGDLRALKEILRGRPFPDSPACGFGMDVSITLTDGQRSITYCPACDGDPFLRINESNRYLTISEEQRERLDKILKKYGMTFPCV